MTLKQTLERRGTETYPIGPDAAREPRTDAVSGSERAVTVDLDDAEPLDVYRAVSVLRRAGAVDVEARVSAGGEGFHVRGFVDAEAFDGGDVETLRYLAGDHPRRTYMDRTHALKPSNITFGRKDGGEREAGVWRSDAFLAADDLRRRSERFGPSGWSP